MKILNVVSLCILLVSMMSCDRPECTNTNSIFNQHQPSSKIYKDELVKELKNAGQSKLTYWLKEYEEIEGEEYLHFYVQGGDLCAIMILSMNDHWDEKLKYVKSSRGVSYRGAEFKNLKFDIQQSLSTTEFIYKKLDHILD